MKLDPWALVVGLSNSVEEHQNTIEQLTLQLSKKEAKLRK
jgi:mannitol/fructose-specific phosphotransferase system IIA component